MIAINIPRAQVVDIHWEPDPIVFADAILTVEEALDHTEIPMAFAAAEVSEDIRDRFATETAPDGTPWAPWSPNYRDYALNFPNIGILQQTGEMAEAASDGNAMIVTGDTLFFDSSALPERAFWHHEGRATRTTRAGTPNPLPARPIFGLSDQTRAVIFAAFGDWFDRAIQLYQTSTGRIGRRHATRGAAGTFTPRSMPMPVRIR